jgi:hypothetical protein
MTSILTIVYELAAPELDPIVTKIIGDIESAGHKVTQVRSTTDAGETKLDVDALRSPTSIPAVEEDIKTVAPVVAPVVDNVEAKVEEKVESIKEKVESDIKDELDKIEDDLTPPTPPTPPAGYTEESTPPEDTPPAPAGPVPAVILSTPPTPPAPVASEPIPEDPSTDTTATTN